MGKRLTDLDKILRCKDTVLTAKVCIVKAIAFLLVTNGLESWTIRKAERRNKMTGLNCGSRKK